MPAEKKQKTKTIKKKSASKVKAPLKAKAKKPAAKKTTAVKKNSIKKTTPAKAAKKAAVKKPTKKTVAKKVAVKKPAKKTATKKEVIKKPTKKTVKKVVAKKDLKKLPAKKSPKTKDKVKAKSAKKTKEVKAPKPEKKESLAKKILATRSRRTREEIEREEMEAKKELSQQTIIIRRSDHKTKVTFKVGDHAIYPSHGVGKIIEIEKTNIAGQEFKCYLMNFEKERLTIKIPMDSANKIGLRPLISKKEMDEVFGILRSGIKKLKGMWSRRAQEYETKINSGDIMLLAEVLRDLTRDIEDSERSYSERIIYETAIYRLASEYSIIYGLDFEESKEKIIIIAKDKLGSEPRINQRDEFDDFDDFDKIASDEDSDEDSDGDEDEDEDDDFNYDFDDEDGGSSKKKRKK